MSEEKDFFETLAENAPDEVSGGFAELPVDAWIIGRNATKEQGGWAPTVKEVIPKNGERAGQVIGHTLKFGLLCVGGDEKIAPEHFKRIVPFEVWLDPGEEDIKKGFALSGRATGALNAIFASGVALDEKDPKVKAAARWKATLAALVKIRDNMPLLDGKPVERGENIAKYLGQLAAAGLEENPRMVLGHTSHPLRRPEGQGQAGKKKVPDTTRIEVGQIEDFVATNAEKRKVTALPDPNTGEVAEPVPSGFDF